MKTFELSLELTNDPLGRGYAAMTNQEAADDLNTLYRNQATDNVTGAQIFNATDDTEYAVLTETQKSAWDRLCAITEIDVSNGVAKAREAELFGPGTQTRINLLALKYIAISRAQELDILEGTSLVFATDVANARALV